MKHLEEQRQRILGGWYHGLWWRFWCDLEQVREYL